jgi:hypothetical protein
MVEINIYFNRQDFPAGQENRMEETKSSYENRIAQDQRRLDHLAHTPLRETYIDRNGVTQLRYSIHDLGQKRGRKLGFCIVDNRRFAMVDHPPLKTRRAAEWYLIEMKTDSQDSTAPGPVGGILKESPPNVDIDTGKEATKPMPVKSSPEPVPAALSEKTRPATFAGISLSGGSVSD